MLFKLVLFLLGRRAEFLFGPGLAAAFNESGVGTQGSVNLPQRQDPRRRGSDVVVEAGQAAHGYFAELVASGLTPGCVADGEAVI